MSLSSEDILIKVLSAKKYHEFCLYSLLPVKYINNFQYICKQESDENFLR